MLSAAFKTELSTLSLQDKLEVFDVIRESVMPPLADGFPELSNLQELELLRRAEHAIANPSLGRSWSEVKKDLEL